MAPYGVSKREWVFSRRIEGFTIHPTNNTNHFFSLFSQYSRLFRYHATGCIAIFLTHCPNSYSLVVCSWVECQKVLSAGFLPIMPTIGLHVIVLIPVVVHDVGDGIAGDVDVLQQRLQIRCSHRRKWTALLITRSHSYRDTDRPRESIWSSDDMEAEPGECGDPPFRTDTECCKRSLY